MSIYRNPKQRRIFAAAAVLLTVGLATVGIANAALSDRTSAKVDVSGVAAAFNAGDKDALDAAITKLKSDLNASLETKATTTMPADDTTSTTAATTPVTTKPVANGDLTKMKIGIIGDSLTDMGGAGPDLLTKDLVSRGWAQSDIKIDGLSGRAIDAPSAACPSDKPGAFTSDVIDHWRAYDFDPQIWVIALGTNSTGSTLDCQKALINGVVDKINSGKAGNYKIYWLGLGFKDVDQLNGTAGDFNDRLSALAQQKNFTACDYNSWLTKNLRGKSNYASLWSDGVHSPNADAYNEVRVPAYGQCVLGQF